MEKIKLFAKSFLGAALGTLIYQLVSSPLVGGFHLYPSLMAMLSFGAVYATLSTLLGSGRPQSIWTSILCAATTVIIIPGLILLAVGTEHIQALSKDSIFEVLAGIAGMVTLVGLSGYLSLRFTKWP